ncbi:Uncharacterised protein [Serratia liquefaciens]|jgi:hypothetical protein|nr:Uncharacterised protein [Serratia liquefaciens]CAI2070453.1 Uncharacterised protein [Serratia liquefaciens]CAI2434129.1 Uncharacterised protein [Serratia liquefaciens]CAI2439049.1 Uncharacterised protein [Serratia liquefaciens]
MLPFVVVELDGDSLSVTGFGPEISHTLERWPHSPQNANSPPPA